jgi:hypothetical protein
MNPLDHKPFRNVNSGKTAKRKQRFSPNPLSGFGKGSDIVVPKNKLAYPPGRHRLVFRAMLDGVRLIESLKDEVEEKSVMPPVKVSKGEQTPSVRPPIKMSESVNSSFFKLEPATPEDISDWSLPEGSMKYLFKGDENASPPTFIIPDGNGWKDYFDGSATYSAADPETIGSCLAADDWLMFNADEQSAKMIGNQDESSPFVIPEEQAP